MARQGKWRFGMNQEIFKVANNDIPTMSIINSVVLHGADLDSSMAIERLKIMLSLIDGAYDIVEVWDTDTSLYNREWKKQWLKAARECGAQPSP